MLKKLINNLSKLRSNFTTKITTLLHKDTEINDSTFAELENTLIAADVGVTLTKTIIES